MGIDCATFIQLCELSSRFKVQGRSLMLGRQKLRYYPGKREFRIPYKGLFQRALDKNGHALKIEEIIQPDNYTEKMFTALGLGAVETMDFSDYEFGPEPGFKGHLHDLNTPVPSELHNSFDFIFDGGTLEHIFDTTTALENIFSMLRPGGRFVGVNPLNGWPGHGMYQFSPELMYSFWVRRCGCDVVNCYAMSENPRGYFKVLRDPETQTGRTKIGHRILLWRPVPRGRLHLYTEVSKTNENLSTDTVQQSSYSRRWKVTTPLAPPA
ncbi:class I SAM-dependent methyltransferase [Pseudorhodobacter sp. W20_MBD10_FR17]|uniref:class I SAM-dependent methyltransferase n=1 Tax=Pseudorhodobacter sp. W20_MBD10_FR17 TaxID=3240266 RepID=UPI003F9D96DB